MVSSNAGVHNPPLFTWIIAALWAPTHDPVAVARLIALINVLCLYPLWRWARRRMDESRALLTLALCAVSPFAVIFSRKIWPVDLLLPGVLAVLWGIEWVRGPKPWRGVVLLLIAGLVAGQLHLSAPIAMALLPIAFVIQSIVDRRRGEPGLRFPKPSAWRPSRSRSRSVSTCSSGLPYVSYFLGLPPGTLDDRPRLDVVRPFLLRKVEAQIMPFDLFYFFEPHRDDFLEEPAAIGVLLRLGCSRSSALRVRPLALAAIAVVASRSRTVVGGRDRRLHAGANSGAAVVPADARAPSRGAGRRCVRWIASRRPWMRRVLFGWRVAYVAAMFGLTVVTGAWLTERGGAAGDYGVAYRIKEAQARAVLERLKSTAPINLLRTPRRSSCGVLPVEVNWIVNWIDPSHSGLPSNLRLCDNWIERTGGSFTRALEQGARRRGAKGAKGLDASVPVLEVNSVNARECAREQPR